MPEGREGRRRGWEQNVAAGTSNLGMIAGPAALYGAVSGRKEGGIPRQIMRRATYNPKTKQTTKLGATKVGRRISNIADKLDEAAHSPKGAKIARRYKIGAGIAAGTAVGLQSANWLGDTIVARSLSKSDRTSFKTEEDLREELKRQRHLGRNTALAQVGGVSAGAAGLELVRRQYAPADRQTIPEARGRAFWNSAGRKGLNRRAAFGSVLALGGPAAAYGAGRLREQSAQPWR